MLNTWWFNIGLYLILYILFTQSYKLAANSSKNDGALTILLQVLSGFIVLLFVPLFKLKFSSDIKTYVLLGIACIFYAISDRYCTSARKGLDVSTFSVLGQLSTVFVITWGILFFKEAIVLKKILGAALILFGNVVALCRKGKFEINKYVIYNLLGNLTMSIGVTVDVGISDSFNMPMYVALTLFIPALIIFIFDRVKYKEIVNELKQGDKKAIFLVSASWGIMLLVMLRAYKFGSVTTIAPICSLTTILNVFFAYFLLKEKNSLGKKVIAAIISVLGIILIKI